MRVHKSVMSFVFVTILFAYPAIADNTWTPADGNQCDVVCGRVRKSPVAVGRTLGAAESYVCSAEGGSGTREVGLRAGFTTKSDGMGCAVYGENGGRFAPAFACLCLDLPVR